LYKEMVLEINQHSANRVIPTGSPFYGLYTMTYTVT